LTGSPSAVSSKGGASPMVPTNAVPVLTHRMSRVALTGQARDRDADDLVAHELVDDASDA